MSRILDYVLEPSVVYTNGSFLVKVKVQDDYKYKKLLVSENMKYTTATGTTYTLTNAVSSNNASILQLEGNTTQNGTPTPTTPIPIYTVSGDNEVVVCGKNKIDISKWVKGRINNSTGNIEYANNVSSMTIGENDIAFTVTQAWNSGIASDFMPVTQETYTYTYSHNREISMYIDAYNSNKTKISRLISYTQSTTPTTRTFTISDSNVKYIRIHFEVNTANVEYIVSNMQLEPGTISTDYEEHKGNSYRVDFGGDNKLPQDKYIASTEVNGITYTNNGDGTFSLSGTASANTTIRIIPVGDLSLKTSQAYYLSSSQPYNSTTFNMSIVVNDNGTNRYLTANGTLTTPSSFTQARLQFYIASGNTVNVQNIKLMLVEGNTAPSRYSPYVSNPIQLNKIGNYVDKLKRAEGKNKADTENATVLNGYFDGSHTTVTSASTNRTTYFKVQPNTTYTVSKLQSIRSFIGVTQTLPDIGTSITQISNIGSSTFDGRTRVSGTITTGSNDNYIVVNYANVNTDTGTQADTIKNSIMINEGSTALPYEPYGNNWYIEKNIEKIVADSSYFNSRGTTGTNAYFLNFNITTCLIDNTKELSMCNMFKPSSFNGRINGLDVTYVQNGTLVIRTANNTSIDWSTNATARTWLDNNKPVLYYVKATPSYEIITNENLINQLNNIQNIELIENLCYVDWVGVEKPTMTLQYPTNEILNAYITTEDNKLIRTDWGV